MKPIDVLIQLVEECGYDNCRIMTSVGLWARLRITVYSKRPMLDFIIAIKPDGLVWTNKTSGANHQEWPHNLHDPESIEAIKTELLRVKRNYDNFG